MILIRQSLNALCNFFPRQVEALRAVEDHTFTLYGGAAGGGKSRFLRWLSVVLLVRWAKRGFHGVRIGLFSADYPTLHDRQLSRIRMEFPEWLGTFNEKDREFRLLRDYGGGVICFRNLDEPQKYKSAEFAAILVEELTEFPESVFEFLRSRLRWPGIEDTKFVGATNPGGVGHLWVKRLWITRSFPEELKPRASEFVYVRALAKDNPHNSAKYLSELDSLPKRLRDALRDGNWDVFAGQVFDEFDRRIHVVKPFEIPQWWRRWGSSDPGHREAGTWYVHAAGEDGRVFTTHEWSWQDRTKIYSDQARAVCKDLQDEGIEVPYWITGRDAFNQHPETGKSIVDAYQEGGLLVFMECDATPGSRKRMAGVVHEYLKPYPDPRNKDVNTARVQIFETCRQLIETLPALPEDENKREQVAECDIDHWYQGWGYGLVDWHTRRSVEPLKDQFPTGTAGNVMSHAKKLGIQPAGKKKLFR